MNRREFFSIAGFTLGTCTVPFFPKKTKAINNKSQAGAKRRKGLKCIMAAKDDAPIVAMCEFEGEMWVATTKEVWVYQRGYHPIKAHKDSS